MPWALRMYAGVTCLFALIALLVHGRDVLTGAGMLVIGTFVAVAGSGIEKDGGGSYFRKVSQSRAPFRQWIQPRDEWRVIEDEWVGQDARGQAALARFGLMAFGIFAALLGFIDVVSVLARH